MKKDKNKTERVKADVSLDEVRDMIWQALDARDAAAYLHSVYGGYIIYELGGKYYRLPYSILEGAVQFGTDPVEVEKVWVETRSQQDEGEDKQSLGMRLGQAQDPEGTAWEVTICQPGFTLNGWYHPEDVLRESAGVFEGADVNLYELPDKGATHVQDDLFPVKFLLVKNKAGWIDGVRHVAGEGLKGVLHFLDSFKWLGANLVKAVDQGTRPYGLSYDAPVTARKSVIDGRTVMELLKFIAVDSVDIVTRPAAGGKFNRAVAAQDEEDFMDKQQIWDMIKGARPDLLSGKELDSISDEDLQGLARMAMEVPAAKPAGKPAAGQDGGDGGGGQATEDGGQATEGQVATQNDLTLFRCEMALDKALISCDLPEAAQGRIRAAFDHRVFEGADLDKAIKDEKDYIAQMAQPQGGGDIPAGSVTGGIGTMDKIQMAVDRTCGLTKESMEGLTRMDESMNSEFFRSDRYAGNRAIIRSAQDYADFDQVPKFKGLMDMYIALTGDSEISGVFNKKALFGDLRSIQDITSSTFTYALGNTLARRLISAYRRPDYGEGVLISTRKPVKDFRQQEAVKIGGFSKLETVNTDTGDYNEISPITDEESTYTVTERGNILTFSRRFILNDDLSLMLRQVDALGIAAIWTFAEFVWSFFADNSDCSDGTAWFTSGHGNLGSSALTIATALVAYNALAKMTEKDSGRRLGLLDDQNVKPFLVHPPDLLSSAMSIANDDHYYTSNDLTTKTANPLKSKVTPKQCSLLTDTSDWGMIMPGSMVDNLEVGFLQGREEPEMAVADSPQSEQVFVGRRIRYRITHDYSGAVVDYLGGYKAVV